MSGFVLDIALRQCLLSTHGMLQDADKTIKTELIELSASTDELDRVHCHASVRSRSDIKKALGAIESLLISAEENTRDNMQQAAHMLLEQAQNPSINTIGEYSKTGDISLRSLATNKALQQIARGAGQEAERAVPVGV